MNEPIDLRSDTVTRPDAAMRRAMSEAEVGDDVLDGDPTVRRLERRVAEMLGKEAALFVPSGVLANLLALRLHAPPGSEVITDREAHVVNFEAGSAYAVAGCGFRLLEARRGVLDAAEVRAAVRPDSPHVPRTSLVWIENTHNLAGGAVWPTEALDDVAAAARDAGLPLHVDGARIWNAAAASGETPARLARDADTVAVCLSKGLGAPVGSLIVGTEEAMRRGWVLRKQLGGGMRQSGGLAAAGLHALEHNRGDLARDHANARRLAERLAAVPGVRVDLDATRTNIVVFEVPGDGVDFCRRAEERGVRMIPFGGGRVRATTHRDVPAEDVARAADVLVELLGSPARAGSAR